MGGKGAREGNRASCAAVVKREGSQTGGIPTAEPPRAGLLPEGPRGDVEALLAASSGRGRPAGCTILFVSSEFTHFTESQVGLGWQGP